MVSCIDPITGTLTDMFPEEHNYFQVSCLCEEDRGTEKDCSKGYYCSQESYHHQKDHHTKGQSQHCHEAQDTRICKPSFCGSATL